MEAGIGEHIVYKISVGVKDKAKLTARNHYIGIDAVSWFVNKEPNWFKEYVACGTLSIQLASGIEKYDIALGTFTLKKETKISPIFERPVLPDRNYRGGPITINIQLSGIENDTVLCSLLKSAANASLGIVSGMVSTATISGPSKILGEAGQSICNGVKELISNKNYKSAPIFDLSGHEYTIQPEAIIGPVTYLLFHRGSKLNENYLAVKESGKLIMPFYRGNILKDGAWLLIRIRRSDEYTGIRDWFDAEKQLRLRVANLVSDFRLGAISQQKALKEFTVSTSGGSTVMDDLIKLRTLIGMDGVISEREAGYRSGQLCMHVEAAKKAILENQVDIYKNLVNDVNKSILEGIVPGGIAGQTFTQTVMEISDMRLQSVDKNTNLHRIADFSIPKAVESMVYMKNLVSDFSKN